MRNGGGEEEREERGKRALRRKKGEGRRRRRGLKLWKQKRNLSIGTKWNKESLKSSGKNCKSATISIFPVSVSNDSHE